MNKRSNKTKAELHAHQELDMLGHGMDKDDMLDAFLPYRAVDVVESENMGLVFVVVGGDDPSCLDGEDVADFARDKASFRANGLVQLVNESAVIVNGQNALPYKVFTFQTERF